MYRKLIPFFTIACLLTFLLPAEEKSYHFGGNAGWPDTVKIMYLSKQHGFNDSESLVLESLGLDRSVQTDTAADLILTFDDSYVSDVTGHYVIEKNNMRPAPLHAAHRGTGTGLTAPRRSAGNGATGIAVRGKPGSFFGTEGTKGSFTIDFWLHPFIAENGEQIVSWRTSRLHKKETTKMISQFIRASVFRNRIEWSFENVFFDAAGKPETVAFSAYDILIPEKWAFHSLAYNEETGLLEYKIDGRLEAVAYVTDSKNEQGKPHTLIFGAPSTIELCGSYSGMIDDFRIRRGYFEDDVMTLFNKTGGRLELPPVDTGYSGSECTEFYADARTPDETAVAYYIRGGDNVYAWTNDMPSWTAVTPGKNQPPVKGRYFQCAAELYTNGNADKTPVLNSISFTCNVNDPPWPPAIVTAETGDGTVTLSWGASGSDVIAGYMIFYGDKSGEYFGTDAAEGVSPILIGTQQTLTLTGLKNGKIYYFAVAAYTDGDCIQQGIMSKELHARPKRK